MTITPSATAPEKQARAMTDATATLVRLINECDCFPYSTPGTASSQRASSEYWLFAILSSWTADCTSLTTVGYMQACVIDDMPWTSDFKLDHSKRVLSIPYNPQRTESEIIAALLNLARGKKSFTMLSGWRDELYPILGVKNRLIEMERAGTPLFGIATRGAHCTAYTYSDITALSSSNTNPATSLPQQQSHNPRAQSKYSFPTLIIPYRSASKSSYPGMLDNTIAGGVSSRESPWVGYLREAGEEVGIAPSIAARAVPTGIISYMFIRDSNAGGETGMIQPETQYCYDLELDFDKDNERVKIVDGEVGGFLYLSFSEAWSALVNNRFKPNCGLVLVDFMIRWGYIRAAGDNDCIWEAEAEAEAEAAGGREGGIAATVLDKNDPFLNEIKQLPPREGFDIPAQVYAEIVARLHRRISFEDAHGR